MKEKLLTPIKAIRAKCIDCSANQREEIRNCTVDCPLKPYRFGRRPKGEEAGITEATTETEVKV